MSVRITRRHRRVLDLLSRTGATAPEISQETNIGLASLWPLLDRFADEGWISVEGRTYKITPTGRAAWKAAQEAGETTREAPVREVRPRPGPPYTDRRTPWPRGDGRPRR